VAAAAARGTGTFNWTPAADPQAIVAPGPLTQAATLVMNQQALLGRFTEQDALRLMTMLLQTQ
jgi:hypothetical protein